MRRTKKDLWKIIPSAKPEDNLYNRRLLSYFSLFYSAIWFQEILAVIVILGLCGIAPDGAVVAALVSVPAALAGLGFWKYLEACKLEDEKREGVPNANPTEPESELPTPAPPALGPLDNLSE